MAIFKNTVSIILTYFDDPLIQYKLYNHSKAYQAFNHIDINHYKLINFLKNNLQQQSDMSLYYTCLITNFPSVPEK